MLPTPSDPGRASPSRQDYARRLALAAADRPVPREMLLLIPATDSCPLASPTDIASECDQTHPLASALPKLQPDTEH